jgi:hypothetical protein
MSKETVKDSMKKWLKIEVEGDFKNGHKNKRN